MIDPRARPLVHHVHSVGTVVLAGVAAIVVAWVLANLPRMSDAAARAAQQRAQEMADQNRALCEKWGLPAGSRRRSECVRDLTDLRSRDRQDAEELDGLP
jgi:hypothetical protein